MLKFEKGSPKLHRKETKWNIYDCEVQHSFLPKDNDGPSLIRILNMFCNDGLLEVLNLSIYCKIKSWMEILVLNKNGKNYESCLKDLKGYFEILRYSPSVLEELIRVFQKTKVLKREKLSQGL